MGRRARARSEGRVSDDEHEPDIGKIASLEERRFGAYVRRLRRARGMTQERLADRSGLSADTIRRLEHGAFSPSLDTLTKLCTGLLITRSTLFECFELGGRDHARELVDLLASRTRHEVEMATNVVRTLLDGIDGIELMLDDAEDEAAVEVASDLRMEP